MTSNRRAFDQCYRLVGEESGIEVKVAQTSPITVLVDTVLQLKQLDEINGLPLPFASGKNLEEKKWWECIGTIENIGLHPVRKLECGGGTYLGGSRKGFGIATHNPKP